MKKPRPKLDFKTMNDVQFENKCATVLASMTGNKSFPKPVPSLKVLEAAIKKYSAALVLAKDRGRMSIQAKTSSVLL